MPHLTLEYTANLAHVAPTPDLHLALHHLLHSVAGIRIENCKSRWRRVDDWVTGAGEAEGAFVHLDLRFLEGRPPELCTAVGRTALDLLRTHFEKDTEDLDLQITVEVGEISRAGYFKFPSGTLGHTTAKEV